ncbi:EAL domain-containing protein [Aquisalimonas sp.]|uniref:sensor domain-containing protein n=1 Tax=unclassified Aquisalimonas TaxID=2644645 RepID=UPI0025C4DCA6|nr:EAL domain-containing protein [Aquisalimonas sp.]
MNDNDASTRLHHELAHFAVENAADGIVWLRSDGTHEYANAAICRMLGYDRDDLLQRTVYDVCAGFTPSLWREHWEDLKQAGSMCFEAELWMTDGGTLPVEINANFLVHKDREYNCASVRDITERKRAEAALNRSDWLLRIAGQAANIGGWALDLQSGHILWSDEVCAIHDMPPGTTPTVDQGIGFYAPEWREHIRKLFNRCATDGTPFDEELELVTARERRIWVRTMGAALRDASGAITQVQGAFQDITEQKNVKRTLDQSRRHFQELADAMPISVWVADGDGHLFYGNRTLSTYSGLERADLSRDGWMTVIHPDDRKRVARAWDRCVRTGRHYSVEFRIRSQRDDSYRWHLVKAVPILDDGGTIVRWYGTATDIHVRRENEEKITRLALYDPLTGLPNRRLLQDRLQHAMSAAARHRHSGAVLFLDLDNFKTLNDTLGHDEGDALLEEVAKRLLDCLRAEDTVARFGGDEFVVVVNNLQDAPDLAAVQAEAVANDILTTLNVPYQLGEHLRHITPSIGITLLGDPDDTVNDLLKRADFAMYQAKAAGRNTLRLFDPEMQAAVNARIELGTRMRAALERDEFQPYYQAQVDAGGQVTGVEALARWNDPERGLISPAQFIPIAEDTGLIIDLGAAILEAACQQLADWARNTDTAALAVSVNISPQQFQHPDFVTRLQTILQRTGAPADRLNLEITESLFLHDTEETINRMMALKTHGIGFSLDDFGTGYSSLYYLKRLPLDQIKIDQRFVRDVLDDPNDAVIVRTIILLAQSLGLDAIAEGVETEAIHGFLERAGCPAFQGYLFGHPQPAADFIRTLRQKLS